MIELTDDHKAILACIKKRLEINLPVVQPNILKVEIKDSLAYRKLKQARDIFARLKSGHPDYETWQEIVNRREQVWYKSK